MCVCVAGYSECSMCDIIICHSVKRVFSLLGIACATGSVQASDTECVFVLQGIVSVLRVTQLFVTV